MGHQERLLFPSKQEPSWAEDRKAAFLQCSIPKRTCPQVSRHQGIPWLRTRPTFRSAGAVPRQREGLEGGASRTCRAVWNDVCCRCRELRALCPLPAHPCSAFAPSRPSCPSSQLCLTPGHCWRVLLGMPSTPSDTRPGHQDSWPVSQPVPPWQAPTRTNKHCPALGTQPFASPRKAEGNGISLPPREETLLSCRHFFTSLLGKAHLSVNAWPVTAGHGCTSSSQNSPCPPAPTVSEHQTGDTKDVRSWPRTQPCALHPPHMGTTGCTITMSSIFFIYCHFMVIFF